MSADETPARAAQEPAPADDELPERDPYEPVPVAGPLRAQDVPALIAKRIG